MAAPDTSRGGAVGAAGGAEAAPLLEVRGLSIHFRTGGGELQVTNDVSFRLQPGERVGVVGESGCGKTVTGLSLLGLLPPPPRSRVEGRIVFEGRDLLKLSPREMREIRGRSISMIFQEPMSALDPVFTIGQQIGETIRAHFKVSAREARERAIESLASVGIPLPAKRVDEYPHQLSGGMRQRAMIAMALACEPKLLIADEPTTALDVTVQAQIIDLLRSLSERTGTALLFITHDLGVVAETCDADADDVCGAGGGGRRRSTRCWSGRASVQLRAAALDSAAQSAQDRAAVDPWAGAVAGRDADGVPVRAALCASRRRLRRAAVDRGRGRPSGALRPPHRSRAARRDRGPCNMSRPVPNVTTPGAEGGATDAPLVQVRDLKVHFRTGAGRETVKAVDGVGFDGPARGDLRRHRRVGLRASPRWAVRWCACSSPPAGSCCTAGRDPYALPVARVASGTGATSRSFSRTRTRR